MTMILCLWANLAQDSRSACSAGRCLNASSTGVHVERVEEGRSSYSACARPCGYSPGSCADVRALPCQGCRPAAAWWTLRTIAAPSNRPGVGIVPCRNCVRSAILDISLKPQKGYSGFITCIRSLDFLYVENVLNISAQDPTDCSIISSFSSAACACFTCSRTSVAHPVCSHKHTTF